MTKKNLHEPDSEPSLSTTVSVQRPPGWRKEELNYRPPFLSLGNDEITGALPAVPSPDSVDGPDEIGRQYAAVHGGTPKPGDSNWKDNNPKDAFGALKVDYTTYLWMPVLYEMSIGMAGGAFKYGAHNYLAIAPSAMTYVGATKRHLDAFVGGEMFDPNAGVGIKLTHVIAAMNSLHVLAAAIINGKWIDDRPPAMPAGFIDNLHEQMVTLKRNNPDPVARYLSDDRRGPGRLLAAQPEKPK